jgi:hypothetical protein
MFQLGDRQSGSSGGALTSTCEAPSLNPSTAKNKKVNKNFKTTSYNNVETFQTLKALLWREKSDKERNTAVSYA